MTGGHYVHPAGTLSRWGVVDVGLKCTHSCRHCFYSFMGDSGDQFTGMRHAKWHSLENLQALVDSLADHKFLGFDVTGGEPTAHPDLVKVIERATSRGLSSRVITLGQFLMRKQLLERLLDAGLTDFRFSLHSTDAQMFNEMTGGDLIKLTSAMDELQRRGFQYVTNTTITEKNFAYLPEIARWMAQRPEIYQATFLYFMPYYEWSKEGHTGDHRVRFSEIAPYLREAVETVEAAGIPATIRYAPQCLTGGLERNHVGIVGVRHDIHEWMNAIDHTANPARTALSHARAMGAPWPLKDHQTQFPLKGYLSHAGSIKTIASRFGSGKVFPEKCRACAAIHVCDGIDRGYLAEFGDGELQPYAEPRGDVIDHERLKYRAAYVMKLRANADVRSIVQSMLRGEYVDSSEPVAA